MIFRKVASGLVVAACSLIALSHTKNLPADQSIGEACGLNYNPPTPQPDTQPFWHGGAIPLDLSTSDAEINPIAIDETKGSANFLNTSGSWTRNAVERPAVGEHLINPAGKEVEMKLLLLSATRSNNQEPALRLVKEALDGIGIPFDHVHLTVDGARISSDPLDLEFPSQGAARRGRYYGVILISDLLAFQDKEGTWLSSLTMDQWAQLREYEKHFQVRRVAVAAYPRPTYGVEPSGDPLTVKNTILMQKSAEPFSTGMVKEATLPLIGSYQNPAKVVDPTLATPIALFGNPDSNGNPNPVAAAITNFPDGREQLNFYFAQSPFLMASYYVAPLWINWVTRGLYLGKRRIYLNLQVDDLFLPNGMWNVQKRIPMDDGHREYRTTPGDLDELVLWQKDQLRRLPKGSNFKVEMAVNGKGVWQVGGYTKDALYKSAKKHIPEFHWVSHTFSHPDLDRISFKQMTAEIDANQNFLQDFIDVGHKNFSPHSLVTPHISGIFNKEALRALFEKGIYSIVGDNSRRELWPLNPFHGFFTAEQTNGFEGIFVIPRHATVAPVSAGPVQYLHSFYNSLYHDFWGKDLTSAEILQLEAERVTKAIIGWRHDPYMFHQGNLWFFKWMENPGLDGRTRHSILSLWTEFVLAELQRYTTLPVLSLKMDDMSLALQERMQTNRCDIRLFLSTNPRRRIRVHTKSACKVPITGLSVSGDPAVTQDVYGPDVTSIINAQPNSSVEFILPTDNRI